MYFLRVSVTFSYASVSVAVIGGDENCTGKIFVTSIVRDYCANCTDISGQELRNSKLTKRRLEIARIGVINSTRQIV